MRQVKHRFSDKDLEHLEALIELYGDKKIPSHEYTEMTNRHTVITIQNKLCSIRRGKEIYRPDNSHHKLMQSISRQVSSYIEEKFNSYARLQEENKELKELLRKLKGIREAVESFQKI